MSLFLLTEIALDLLGNKFYTPDGEHVRNLKTLYKLSGNEPSTGENSLQTLLCISETSLRAADNLQSDVIVLDDDELKSTTETINEPVELLTIAPRKVSSRVKRRKGRRNKIKTKLKHSSLKRTVQPAKKILQKETERPSTSTITSTDRTIKPKIGHRLHAEDVNKRLSRIVKACSEEYAQMKDESNTEKESFLQLHATSANEVENYQLFYKQEKDNLIKENKILMEFLRLIRSDQTYPRDVLAKVESDILKAKDLIF